MKFSDQSLERLSKVIGTERTEMLRREALQALGITTLTTPQEVLDFATYLTRYGGVIEAIGRAMKVQALLRGAIEAPPEFAKTG